MTACGKSPDADAIRINAVIFGMKPDVAHGALSVPHFNRVMVARAQSVLQNECSDADRIKPFGDVGPLLLHGKVDIPTARTYHYPGPDGFRRVREINCERWNVFRPVAQGARRGAG